MVKTAFQYLPLLLLSSGLSNATDVTENLIKVTGPNNPACVEYYNYKDQTAIP